jgi:DHA2 family multidrug resistance protein
MTTIAFPNFLYGMGIFLSLTPLVPLSCSTIKNEAMTNATGLQNLLKNVGGAIGTSLSTTMIARFSQVHQMMLVRNMNFSNETFNTQISYLASEFSKNVDNLTAIQMAQGRIYSQLVEQSHLWGYIDTFRWFAFATFLLIPAVLLLNNKNKV